MVRKKNMKNAVDIEQHTFRSKLLSTLISDATVYFINLPIHNLPLNTKFFDGGVYALYYIGPLDYYKNIRCKSTGKFDKPIYIGKAVPQGWRMGRKKTKQDRPLYSRLRDHCRSITLAENLKVSDFKCRFMILNQHELDLIVPVEANLIRQNTPVWNSVLDGFGNHDPGSGRYNQARSEWDILHKGRNWVNKLPKSSIKKKFLIDKIMSHL